MDELNERDLLRVRLRFLDLSKSFFFGEPDAEKISRWRGTFSALVQEQVSPRFDRVVKELSDALSVKSLKELQDEYYSLFVDPFDGDPVNTNASFYLDGRSFGQSLVEIRGLLNDAGLQKDESVTDPEDSLVVMLDSFASLVEEEKKNGGEAVKQLQARLLTEFLDPFSVKFCEALEENKEADFFAICGRFLNEYLDLERSLFVV
ncbi:MAG: molecular chaperone TorD family protein [Deltaproteobacteria bacterium]|nr:molecular chaperone TorD family protein [Deltaproteobacteria bacterium]